MPVPTASDRGLDPSEPGITGPMGTRLGAMGTRLAPMGTRFASWRPRFALGCILGLAFLLRVVYVLQSRSSPNFDEPQMDALYHLEWARAWAAGGDFQPGPFFRAPLYPWFLGLCLRLFGENLLLVRLVQALIGTASAGLVYLLGARAFDRRVGLLAAFLVAIDWVLIYFDGELLLPVLEVPLDLLAVWLTLRLSDGPRPASAALAGAAWGLSAIVRPNVLLFAPVLAAWILARTADGWRRRLATAAAFGLALLAPILPITATNRIAGGDWVLISSQGGVNGWIGNNPSADGSSAIVPGARADWWGGYHDSIKMAEVEEGRPLAPSEVSRHYSRKAWAWIRSEPRRALGLLLWKLRLFWTDWELGNNSSETFFAYRFGPILRWLPLGFGVLAPLALLGLLLSARHVARLLPLWGFVPVYTASVVAFFVCSRFRVPVVPALAVLAAHACVWALDAAKARRWLSLSVAAVVFLALARLVGTVPAAIDRSDSNGLWQLGLVEARHGNWEAAVELYHEAVAARPRNRYALRDLGLALSELGRRREAEQSLLAAFDLDPCDVVVLGALVDLRLADHRLSEAREAAERSIACSPAYAPARYDLGRVTLAEAEAGDPGAARARKLAALEGFRAGLDLATDEATAFNCAFAAGSVLSQMGRFEDAVAVLRRALAVRVEPDAEGWWWTCQTTLVQSLLSGGRRDEASRHVQEIERRYPSEPRARALRNLLGS